MTFLRSKGDLTSIYDSATSRAGPYGIDSLDLLASAAASRSVAEVVRRLGLDPVILAQAADEARVNRQAGPGLTDDAKRVVEGVAGRSLERRRNAAGPDLLIALASVESEARSVLLQLGLDEARLGAVLD